MISVKSISDALSSVDEKKEDLREAFENLQCHSSSLASFNLKWKDIEGHFDSILKSMEGQLKDLESKEIQASNSLFQKKYPSEIEKSPAEFPLMKSEDLKVTPSHPKLKPLCVNMDGKGLHSYVSDQHRRDLPTVRAEFAVAIQSASDPVNLVLDAIQALYPSNNKDAKIIQVASFRACILFLEQLASMYPQIEPQVKEKAKKLAVEWKGLLSLGCQKSWRVLAFLQLVGTYGLVSTFSTDELLDFITLIAQRSEIVDTFGLLNIPDKAPDLIEKLISSGKQLDAVKFVYAFNLVDRFPPLPLLKEYVFELNPTSKEICKNGTSSNLEKYVARRKEISRLRTVQKYIEEHNLESEFPNCHGLFKDVEWLVKMRELKKSASEKPQQQQETGNKRPRRAPKSETVSPLAQPSFHQHGFISDRTNPYYGSRGSIPPPFASYASSSVAPYGLAGTHMGYGGKLSPNRAHFYSSELHTHGSYGLLPQYHPPYYP